MSKPVILLTFANEEERFLNSLKEESDALNKVFMGYKRDGYIEVERDESATMKNLSYYLQNYHNRISIFHYAGHASSWSLMFEGGKSHPSGFAGLLAAQESLMLVFLNGCATFQQSQLLLSKGVKAIIGTSLPIKDGLAKDFSEHFYRGLTLNQSIKDSFTHTINYFKSTYDQYSQVGDETIAYYRGIGRAKSPDTKPEPTEKDLPWQLLINENYTEEVLNWKIPVPEQKLSDHIKIYPSGAGKKPVKKKAPISGTPKIFLMYDYEDKAQVDKLKKFLSLMARRKEIEIIDMHEFEVLNDQDEETRENINNADFVLCLITFNFLFTTYEWAEEAREIGKPIIPIRINVVGLEDTFFPKLRMLPSNKKAIAEWPNEDAAYTDIVKNLRVVFKRAKS